MVEELVRAADIFRKAEMITETIVRSVWSFLGRSDEELDRLTSDMAEKLVKEA